MYKVKAVYDYSSPHEDDLDFKVGQIISVTEEEGDDWLVGEYTNDSGTKRDGLFPRNFVERYEPAPPPRPNRASRYKPTEPPAAQEAPPMPQPEPAPAPASAPAPEPAPVQQEAPEPAKPQPPPLDVPAAAKSTPLPMSPMSPPSASSAKAQEAPRQPSNASPKPAPAGKKPPPPVASKSNAFRDRIAAFNAPAAAPIQPFKPSGGAPTNFIKKPFVAPPPSRNAYIPPTREAPPVKTYRREEDPEIAQRQAQTQNDAERAGLAAHDSPKANEGEEESQPKVSLKERIALLQKQQQEQAERAAAMHKEKPKRPPVAKRTESQDAQAEDSEDTGLERVTSGASRSRASVDHGRPPRSSHDIRSPDSQHRQPELVSENDADQSGAGETEDAGGESTSVEDEDRPKSRHPPPPPRAAAAPTQEPDVGDEQDVAEEEEEEEDEMDAETRRKLELRQRMAKMSGGMGMPGMFGGMPMGGLPPPKPKKKPTLEKKIEESEGYTSPQQRVPMFGIPGVQSVRSPEQEEDRSLSVEKEDETPRPVTESHPADEVPDVEDVAAQQTQQTPTGERPPPIPTDRRPVPPPVPSASRPIPPPPPQIMSPGPGSESGDEMTDAATPNPPSASLPPQSKRTSFFSSDEQTHDLHDRRAPPVPSMGPTSPTLGRPPPPPPPSQAPPSRHEDLPIRKLDRTEGETDYEGDYDTDMAPDAPHKEALKSHATDSGAEDNTTADEPTSARSPSIPHGMPPMPPSMPRPAPPPPPQQPPSRSSTDAARGPPPPPPGPPPPHNAQIEEDDDEYDPYRYTGPPTGPPPPPQSQPPPPVQSRPPPPIPPSKPPVPQQQQQQAAESSDEDDLYSSPGPRKSHDRPPPPPLPQQQAPPMPPQDRAPPMPPQERVAPPPPHERPMPMQSMESQARMASNRKSLDVGRALGGRVSIDQMRPTNQEFMATDIDLGASSNWWAQPQMLPPSLQNRKDVLVDMKETQSGNMIEKLVNVLYFDYSQTIVSARFDINNVSDVELEQRNDPPPPRQRPDQLESAYEQFGRQIAKAIESKQNTVVGNGTPHGLIDELLKPYNEALPPISTRAFGALVYANLANASTQVFDEIRPGDIITFRNAKFQGKAGPMHAKYSMDVGKPDHVGVVVEWDGSKKKVRAWEQGREHKKVKPESYKMGDLRSGEVRVWRVMSRSWVGWN